MTDIEYLGNCSHLIDFNSLINQLGDPDAVGPTANTTDTEISDIIKIWNQAGYKTFDSGGTIKWGMYYPEKSFDKEILEKIIKFIDIPYYNSAWISRVDPGYCVAPHYDRMPKNIKPYRLHIHLEDPCMGHIFYVGNTYLTDYKKGDIFLWKNAYEWHAGSNISTTPKYILNFY